MTNVELLLIALGYPIGSVLVCVILLYLGRQLFGKLLDSIVKRDLETLKRQNREALETLKNEYKLVLEDKKAELAREKELLKNVLSVETETYILAARKRFECLLSLWISSESLLKGTNFSDIKSIKASLKRVDKALLNVDKYSVLLSSSTTIQIHSYLVSIAKVLTNSEKNYKENSVTSDKISNLINAISKTLSFYSPALNLVTALGDFIVPSITEHLEKLRYNSALKARQNLEKVIRIEFGVWISENRNLDGKEKQKCQGVRGTGVPAQ